MLASIDPTSPLQNLESKRVTGKIFKTKELLAHAKPSPGAVLVGAVIVPCNYFNNSEMGLKSGARLYLL